MSHITDRIHGLTADVRKHAPLDVLAVLGVGVLVGGALVAFLTPVSGPELRRRIGRGLSRVANRLEKRREESIEHHAEPSDPALTYTRGKVRPGVDYLAQDPPSKGPRDGRAS